MSLVVKGSECQIDAKHLSVVVLRGREWEA